MMLRLEPNDLLLFAKVVEEGSFSRAASRLGLPKSTVSRRVSALESHLGERLLLRTTRRLTVTEFGQEVLTHARHVADDVDAAESLAQSRQSEPTGRLRVTMPNDLANLVLALAPTRVVLGGGVGTRPGLRARISQQLAVVLAGYVRDPAPESLLVGPELGKDSGVVGALELGRA